MSDLEEHPELAGYDPTDDRPLPGRRRRLFIMRIIVVLGVIALVLPGIVTTISVGSATAQRACAIWVRHLSPDASESSARFELFGPSGMGWECYAVGTFGGDRHVASLGLIPGGATLLPATENS
ncbi:hypothetical protein [Parafrigoribacterium soli]|uniref:hypothetical protein n=1 Tax=Parafrigoribacterium soli TaxID=3144663 RepID=UPI0032EC41F1